MKWYVASTWRRFIARWLDSLVDSILCLPVFLQYFITWFRSGEPRVSLWLVIATVSFIFLMKWAFLYYFSATPGKWLMGLRVVSVGSHASELGILQSLIRNLSDHLSLFFGWGFFAAAFLRFDRRHVSDLLAETQVVQIFPRLKRPKVRWVLGPALIFIGGYFGVKSVKHNLSRCELDGDEIVISRSR